MTMLAKRMFPSPSFAAVFIIDEFNIQSNTYGQNKILTSIPPRCHTRKLDPQRCSANDQIITVRVVRGQRKRSKVILTHQYYCNQTRRFQICRCSARGFGVSGARRSWIGHCEDFFLSKRDLNGCVGILVQQSCAAIDSLTLNSV